MTKPLAVLLLALAFTARAADTLKPTLVIKSPLRGAHVTNATLEVRGTAKDNVAVNHVLLRVENSNGIGAYSNAAGTTNWTNSVTLAPGLNTLRARAVDTSTNLSAEVTTTVNYDLYLPLSLQIDHGGRVLGATNNQRLLVGKLYTLTALPNSGYVFLGWTNETTFSIKPAFSFHMPDAPLTLRAVFAPSTYSGVFEGTNASSSSATNSGLFVITRTGAGFVTGRLVMQGRTFPFSGNPVTNGLYAINVTRPALSPLQAIFNFNGIFVQGTIVGPGIASQLIATSLDTTNKSWAGRYNAIVNTSPSDGSQIPTGYGPTVITITGANASIIGTLPDGTTFNTSSPVSATSTNGPVTQMALEVNVPLQNGKGIFNGLLVLDRATNGVISLEGARSFWQKAPAPKDALYPNGFAIAAGFYGYRYTTPPITNATLLANATLSYGNVLPLGGPAAFTKNATWARTKITLTDTEATNAPPAQTLNAVININPTTGAVTGTFKSPGTGLLTKINAIQIQRPTAPVILGHFLGTNRTGRLVIEPH